MNKIDLLPFLSLLSEHTELRQQENRSCEIAVVAGNVVRNNSSSETGVSVRTNCNGNYGFASTPLCDDASIKNVINKSQFNADFLSKQNEHKLILPVTYGKSDDLFFTQQNKKSQQDKIDFLMEIDKHVEKIGKELSTRTIMLKELDMEKNLLTGSGSSAHSMIPKTIIYIVMNIQKDGENTEFYDVYGGFGQFEDVFTSPECLFEKIEKQYKSLLDKADGVHAEAGYKDVIIDSKLAGVLAHEAVGHTTEADFVMGGSVAGEFLNKQVASDMVTLVDYANTAFGKQCPVPLYVDDEGTKAEDAVIIEKGILKKFMHNKESATTLGFSPTGNARSYQFSDEPLIRMRNTAILPGTDKLEDMISSIDDGYYLIQTRNGQADSTSEFMFGIIMGYQIKNGKLEKAIKDTTIAGVAFDMLKTVSMISDEMSWSCSGMCGKKQAIPVGMGGPAIKCKINIGGK